MDVLRNFEPTIINNTIYNYTMSQESVKITHHTNRTYVHSLAARTAFISWPVFILINTYLAVIVAVVAYLDVPIFFSIISLSLFFGYVLISLLMYTYLIILFSKTIGYSQGSYTFSFDKKGYSEISRTMNVQVFRDSIKKITIEKKFVTVRLGLYRNLYLPKSEKLVAFLEKNYQDKLKK